MENKARYTLVGLFVLSFFIAMIAFVLWLARYNINQTQFQEYRIYVTKSIAGLKPKSIVYYKGLDIGTISNIQINPNNLEEIEIILHISKPNLVKTNTYAQIESQGVTGNKVIELAGGTQEAKALPINEKGYAILPIKKTFLDNLTQNATKITDKADIFFNQLNQLLNENNLQGIKELITNINHSSLEFNQVANSVDQLVTKDVKQSLNNINTLISKDMKQSLNNINALSTNISTLSQNINQLIQQDIKGLVQEFKQTTQSAQNVDEIMVEFENTLSKLNQTIDNINYNGSNIIFNQRNIKYGPGERP